MKKSFIFLVVCLFIFSCSKEKSKNWIFFDVDVINVDTGEPVVAYFTLKYTKKAGFNKFEESSSFIGESTPGGKFLEEVKLPRNSNNFSLSYYAVESDYPKNLLPVQFDRKTYVIDEIIKSDEINKFVVEVKPVYQFYLHITNSNCFDEADTLWATKSDYQIYQDGEVFTGCVDTVVGGPAVSFESKRTMYYRLKRDDSLYLLSKEIDFLIDSPPFEFNY